MICELFHISITWMVKEKISRCVFIFLLTQLIVVFFYVAVDAMDV